MLSPIGSHEAKKSCGGGGGGGGGVHIIMHVRGRMTVDPRIHTYNAGTEHVGFLPIG